MTPNEEKRNKRRKQTAEVFTPPALTNEILDKLPDEVWEPMKTFCDPACGNGNMLLEVLKRKLSLNHDPLQAISTIWGVDLMEDNIEEAKGRFLDLIPEDAHSEALEILNRQIVCHDALKWDFINWRSNEVTFKKLF